MVKFKLKKFVVKSYRYIFVPPEEGQGLVEYALILFLVAIVVIGILATIGPAVYNVINNVVDFGLS